VRAIVTGGERRHDSVAAGLAELPEEVAIIVIHDGARPLAEAALFDRCARAAARSPGGAAIAAIPVADTMKRVTDGSIAETVDRTGLWAAQTPQAFRLETLRRVMAAAPGGEITDEARLCELAGIPVAVVPGSPANLKVTHPEDIAVADALLQARRRDGETARRQERPIAKSPITHHPSPITHVGIGYDAHRLVAGRRLVLGGVEIAHERGLAGHSDADVLLHAIADAVLGAAALGDIGQHFPPGDEHYRDADSEELLRASVRLARQAGWVPANVDATVLAEAPRIAPHARQMRERIAACLGIATAAVSVKATTNEGLGAIGRGEGIAALATVTLVEAGGRVPSGRREAEEENSEPPASRLPPPASP
jgi:2-C-methyl-D-erythritol 4-phosphate cytidylyltransferase/2-C-methyl-D-erythritol 2,4-cyclodiphosphate synthase